MHRKKINVRDGTGTKVRSAFFFCCVFPLLFHQANYLFCGGNQALGFKDARQALCHSAHPSSVLFKWHLTWYQAAWLIAVLPVQIWCSWKVCCGRQQSPCVWNWGLSDGKIPTPSLGTGVFAEFGGWMWVNTLNHSLLRSKRRTVTF